MYEASKLTLTQFNFHTLAALYLELFSKHMQDMQRDERIELHAIRKC